MMRFSVAFLGLLFASAAAAASTEEDSATAMVQLHKALALEKERPKAKKDNHFARRLAGVDLKHKLIANSKKLDSMKEVVTHLNAAQDNREDLMQAAEHIKSAVSNLNVFVKENSHRHRHLQGMEATPMAGGDRVSAMQAEEPVPTAAEFHQAIQCMATAAMADDTAAFLGCAKTVKAAMESAVDKANAIVDALPSDQLAQILADSPTMETIEDPGAMAAIISKGISSIIQSPADVSASQIADIPDARDFFQLLWMVPVSVVWGGFLWMFIGLWTYGPSYGIIGSLWFEISWIMSGLGCWFDNPLVCGIWNP